MSERLLAFEADADYGYCGQCGQPVFMAMLMLRGWKHRIPVCTACLDELTREAASKLWQANQRLEAERAVTG